MQEEDRYRQEMIEPHGIRIFRYTAQEGEKDLSGVLGKIIKATKDLVADLRPSF